MLTIRDDQLQILKKAKPKNFEDEMVKHLNRFFLDQCLQMGEEEVRKAIQYGIKRAAEYGILPQREICKYINVMFVFGRDFDKDKKLPWASKILQNPLSQSSNWVIKDLYEVAIQKAGEGSGYTS